MQAGILRGGAAPPVTQLPRLAQLPRLPASLAGDDSRRCRADASGVVADG